MARIPNTPRTIATRTLNIIQNFHTEIDRFFSQSIQTNPPLDSSYKTGRVAAAKADFIEMWAVIKWAGGEFSLTEPAAKTDAEMKLIDEDILDEEED